MELTHPLQATGGESIRHSIYSVGMAAQLLQALPDKIKLAASQLGVEPTCIINGVEHFAAADLERIGRVIRHAPPQALQLR